MIDMTSCIAGGSGAQQNEYDLNAGSGGALIGTSATTAYGARGVVSSTFTVSGNSASNTLRGSTVHALVMHQWVDLLDYVGGNTDQEPSGLSREEKSARSLARVMRSVLWRGAGDPAGGRPTDVALGADQKAAPPKPLERLALVRESTLRVAEEDWEFIELSGKRAMRHRVTGELKELGTGETRSKVAPGK